MSGLTRWEPFRTQFNPWRELEDVEKRLSAMWGRTPAKADGQQEAIAVAEWSPLVDITEDEKEYLIKAELPEIKKEDVKLTVQDNVLAISGERKYEKEEKGKKYHRVERAYGSFLRASRSGRCRRQQGRRGIQRRHPQSASAEIGTGQSEIDRGEGLLTERSARVQTSSLSGYSLGNALAPGQCARSPLAADTAHDRRGAVPHRCRGDERIVVIRLTASLQTGKRVEERKGMFKNREEAGELLAQELVAFRNDPDAILLALPRGG